MSTTSQFIGGRGKIATIVNAFSQGSASQTSLSGIVNYGKNYATTAQTANTLRTILSLTGKGAVNFVGVYTTDSTSKTLRLKVTIDSVVVFDATSATITSGSPGIIAIGFGNGVMQPVKYSASLLVEMASSVASDTQATTVINYETDS
jgi:hypothetical protein